MSETSQAETALSLDSVNADESICPSKDLCTSFDTVKDVIPISIDDPSAFVDWRLSALQAFVNAAGTGGMPPPPAWVGLWPPTPESLTTEIVTRVGSAAGGIRGAFCWAPNTQGQFVNVFTLIDRIEADVWMQVHTLAVFCLPVQFEVTDHHCIVLHGRLLLLQPVSASDFHLVRWL